MVDQTVTPETATMFVVTMLYGGQVRQQAFCVLNEEKVGEDVRRPAEMLWRLLEPGEGRVVEFDAYVVMSAADFSVSPSQWAEGVADARAFRVKLKLDCRYLLQVEAV